MGKDLPTLQIRAQHIVYIVNTSADELTVANNAYLAGFGKGSFKLLPGNSEPAANQTEYVLKNHDDLVVFNGIVMSLGKVVADERSKMHGASLAYLPSRSASPTRSSSLRAAPTVSHSLRRRKREMCSTSATSAARRTRTSGTPSVRVPEGQT